MTSFNCIFRSIYIRQLIFNHIGDISKQRYNGSIYDGRQRSLKGRDIIKLPDLGMISRFAMPWHFLCHYLPSDCNQMVELKNQRRIRLINEYCFHRNATLDTFEHLVEWSTDFEYLWNICATLLLNRREAINQEILEYLVKKYPRYSDSNFLDRAIDVAVKNGYLSTVKLIDSIGADVRISSHVLDTACSKGFIDIIKYVYENNRTDRCSTDGMDEAANHGHFDIVKILHFNSTGGCTKNAMDMAAQNGHFEMVKFLHENRQEGCTCQAIDLASLGGHIDIVRYLSEHRTEGATTNAMDRAASNGHYEIVKYLQEHRSEGATTKAMDGASANGRIEIVKYLSEHRSEGATTWALDWAAENGHIKVVSFLINVRKEKYDAQKLLETASLRHYDLSNWILTQFGDTLGIESLENVKN
ncbi:hypothetical protein DFA_04369 [Cavenderia fasciculata]|uniref:Ankyrin repeat-containing protein n=1 Tax=Cavenderia fasciculata TaxID=261658 RepID=F4PPD8_CACFS|nr:uncharacterized protein DFA_04369 [Cavenderia fasciculata]EGG22251.1 hypothetical protein DFA_04369 [Cavenderia fasciculata]|eukprot:XP_004360102.1 hypothetical protein DFA_04369 [Cavenderia fasciculata]